MEPLEGSKQRNEIRVFGFSKLILMGRVKKKKKKDGLDEDQMQNREKSWK